jgi:hypothetical protein
LAKAICNELLTGSKEHTFIAKQQDYILVLIFDHSNFLALSDN